MAGIERTRQHRVVTRRDAPPPEPLEPIDDFDDFDGPEFADHGYDGWVEPEPAVAGAFGIDQRLLRIGAIAAVAVLAVPVALALRDDGPSDDLRAVPSTLDTTTTVALLGPSPVSAVPVTAGLAVAPTVAPASDDDTSSDSDDEAAAAAVAEEEAPECAGTYTVVAGDYWIRFVDSSGATLDEWLAANDAAPDTELHVGDELCIPAGAQAPTPTVAETAPHEPATPATEAAQVPAPTAPPETSPPPPPPVETAAPAPVGNQASGRVATTDEVQALIREIWPDDIEERALQIAYNEAKWRPDLHNWCCYGVFALYFDFVPANLKARYGVDDPSDLYDARTNISIAYEIYLLSGWDPWAQTDPGG